MQRNKILFKDGKEINKEYLCELFKGGTERVCIHKDEDAELHSMIIHKIRGDTPKIHMHPYKDEICVILEGNATINLYDDDINFIDDIKLSPYDDSERFVYIIQKGVWHTTIPHTDIIYLECVKGPFDKNTHNRYLYEK